MDRVIRRRDRLFRPLAQRIFPRVPDFHALLLDQCEVVVDALESLLLFVRGRAAPEHGARVRELEKIGDQRRARTLRTLARAFATPFDRDAIYLATVAIDDVVNYAKTTVREIEMLDVVPDARMGDMVEELRAGGVALRDGFGRLRGDPAGAATAAAAVHKAERNVEKLYRAAVAELFSADRYVAPLRSGREDAVPQAVERLLDALRRREVYRHLSNGADRLDAAGRALHDIVVGEV
jgi:uncharacterized protein Yka (UPF0111/DUF47 family)